MAQLGAALVNVIQDGAMAWQDIFGKAGNYVWY